MENAALLKAIIEYAIDGIITMDDQGCIETINPSACRLFSYLPDEIIGQNISVLISPIVPFKNDTKAQNFKQLIFSSDSKVLDNFNGIRKNGSIVACSIGISEVQFL